MRRYDLAKSVFLHALELEPGERAAFVAGRCGGDAALLAEVEGLLAYHDDALAGLEAAQEDVAPERIGGYRILGELGRGGMGVVYLARREGEAPVALKVLRNGVLSPALIARFRREATVLSRLDHPGIARLIETGVDQGPAGPRPWLAMQSVEGLDLRAWAAVPRGPQERLELVARICDAVEHAHGHDVVHRDLKPENILVRPDGQPVVLDFGVARLADSDLRATTVMTAAGLLVGTIRYMSPEQAEGRPEGIGPRSDVYALGVLAYELLTGRLPYEVPENSVHRALVAVMTAPPMPMKELPGPLRGRLERVLRRSLAKAPEHRLAGAAALAADLRRIAAGRPPLARALPGGAARLGRRGRWAIAIAAAALLAGVARSAWRTPPTPADWAQGTLAPAVMFDRVTTILDSAAVRVHYTTRTLAREREALAYVLQAKELARTLGGQPYGPRLGRRVLYRQAEAEYLIAERTNDASLFEAASAHWYASREPVLPDPDVALPDTLGPFADSMLEGQVPASWLSASMALCDAARLGQPVERFERAVRIAREGALARAADLAARVHAGPDTAATVRSGAYVEGRLGAALVGLGFHAVLPESLMAGLTHLHTAVALAAEVVDPPAVASNLHELGAGEARGAALLRSAPMLDSGLVHIGRAYDIRAGLEGYTSRLVSRLELAQAHRLAARLDRAPGARARHLERAERLLALPSADRALLGDLDAGLYELACLALHLDECCVRRDSVALAALDAPLLRMMRTPGGAPTPMLQAEAGVQRGRFEALRGTLAGDPLAARRAHQSLNLATLLVPRGQGSSRFAARVSLALQRLEAPPGVRDLDYPVPEPY